jgi:hypothetical protein
MVPTDPKAPIRSVRARGPMPTQDPGEGNEWVWNGEAWVPEPIDPEAFVPATEPVQGPGSN